MENSNLVTVKVNGVTIRCKPEDVSSIVSSLNGVPASNGKKVYEKSAIIHKAIRNLKADNPEELVLNALANREGLHVVFSGLNSEIRTRFGVDPQEVTEKMITAHVIKGRPAKGGFYISRV